MVKRRNIWLAILDVLLVGVTVVAGLALLFALIADWFNPNTTTFFAFFALGAPILYFVNFILLCLWVIRWNRWAFVPAVVLVFGIGGVGKFVQMDWGKEYHQTQSKSDLTIFTYNVHNFTPIFKRVSTLDQVCRSVNESAADLVFLQEYSLADSATLARFDSLLTAYPYRAYEHNVTQSFAYRGQIILSRYPLSVSRTIAFDGSDNSIVTVDMVRAQDTLRLFGCHLQTTSFNAVSGEQGVRSMIESQQGDSLTRTAIAALAHNFRLRAVQADTLRMLIDESPYPVIVAGDFNSPPLTYTYATVRGDLADAFCSAGSGYGYTYKPMKGMFRIDYVLFDDDYYDAASYLSPDLPYSDHNPVITRLKKI